MQREDSSGHHKSATQSAHEACFSANSDKTEIRVEPRD